MVIFSQIVAIIFNICIAIDISKLAKRDLRIIHVATLFCQVIYVTPILFDWLFGVADYGNQRFIMFRVILQDEPTSMIYSLIVIVFHLILYINCRRRIGRRGRLVIGDIKQIISSVIVPRWLYGIAFVFMFAAPLAAVFAPSPELYFKNYAYFVFNFSMATIRELTYDNTVMKYSYYAALVAIAIVKMGTKNRSPINIFVFIAIISTTIINGKRTWLAFVLLAILIIEILKSKRVPYARIVLTGFFTIAFFLAYVSFTGKGDGSSREIFDVIRMYFLRDIYTKSAVYSLLYPHKLRILEYFGQSMLFNVLFFIPRSMWPGKPWPYSVYLTSAILNVEPGTLMWSYQSSLLSDMLANFGWLGILTAPLFMITICNISEDSENPLAILLGLFLACFVNMMHFPSYALYFGVWFSIVVWEKTRGTAS